MRSSYKALAVVGVLVAVAMLLVPRSLKAAAFVSLGDGGWEWVSSIPTSGDGAFFLDDKTGWVLGPSFNVLKTTDGGKNWAPQGCWIDKAAMDICFADEDNGWIVGSGFSNGDDKSGIILRTTDGGVTWRKVLDGKTDGLRSICMVNNKIGWAVGGLPSNKGVILKTTDGGETWFEQDTGVPVNEGGIRVFEGVSFVDENTGWVVTNSREVYRTTDGGRSWTLTKPQGVGLLRQVQFLDRNTGWILSRTMLRTTDGGKTWTEQQIGKGSDYQSFCHKFHFFDSQNGIVTLMGGEVHRTQDGGKTWTPIESPGQGTVYMTGKASFLLVDNSSIHRTSDGGATWQVLLAEDSDSLYGIHFMDRTTGWAAGHTWEDKKWKGLLAKTEDGGQTWNRRIIVPESGQLWKVRFVDDQTGWTAGMDGAIQATKDGGKTWQAQNSGTKVFLLGLHFIGKNTGWAVGKEGVVLKTSDGGAKWTRLNLGTMDDIWGVYFLDESTGWATGSNGRIMKTTDGGNTWKRQPSGITKCIAGVHFLDENRGWVSDSAGQILATTDGGNTWTRQWKTDGSDQFAALSFLDTNTGWAAGKALIRTDDGGKTWTSQHTGSHGAWDACFVDTDNGWAVGGPTLLRTTTGGLPGAVWAKKQADGKQADFGHLVVTKKSDGYLLAEHPDSRVGIHIKTSDSKPNVGDYIYVHGKVASEDGERIIAADSIDIMCAGWGILPDR